jgi:uncharacterized membrane protein YhaH (DUF805 family)
VRNGHSQHLPSPQYPPGSFAPLPDPYLDGAEVGYREAVWEGLHHVFAYRGRASRSAYWWFVFFQGGMFVIWFTLRSRDGVPGLVIFGSFVLYGVLANLALYVRRLHDTDRSTWWPLVGFVPLLGQFVLLIFGMLSPFMPGLT